MMATVIHDPAAEALVLDEPSAETIEPHKASSIPRRPGGEAAEVPESGNAPELWLYRDRTLGLLKRYLRLSVEVGRLPSLLGREFFRTRVTSYRVSTFEDAVIFVHDVERSLEKLESFDQELIARIALQEYTQEEAANMLGCWRRTVGRRYAAALDQLSEIFLKGGLLNPLPGSRQRER
jgi:predicted DNA-binding protein (UPF0251 family)